MDGQIVGGMLQGFFNLLLIFAIAFILAGGFLIYHFGTTNHKVFKTREKPAVSWELVAHGQTVDTIYIYKFK